MEELAVRWVEAAFTTHALVGMVMIGLILLQVAVVLCSLYLRPVRSWGQALKLLAILCVGLAICMAAIWLLWQLEML